MISQTQSQTPLRIVTFNNISVAFQLTQQWAAMAGHKVVMAVTSPGPKTRRSTGYREISAMAGEQNIELLITTRMKAVATPILQTLKPDLIVSFSFPWLLPPELLATARLGAINMHPALLPAYRGPNAARQFFDMAPEIGATLHWTDGSFDTGRILSQHRAPLPRPCTQENVFAAWGGAIMAALTEGAQKAIAGDPGIAQSEEGASYAERFTEQEHWLNLNESAYALQCKVLALAFGGEHPVRVQVGGAVWEVKGIDLVEDQVSEAAPGSVIEELADGLLVQTGEGVARLAGKRALPSSPS
jgi:methionyl-tRNA formyltransferase